MTQTEVLDPPTQRSARQIGLLGTAARAGVGGWFLVRAIRLGVDPLDILFGLVAANAAVITLLALRGRSAPPLRLTGPISHAVNIAVPIILLNTVHVPALLFYGSAMLLAAARGYGACEMFALSNGLRRRDDQFGCPWFLPADIIDGLASGRQRHC